MTRKNETKLRMTEKNMEKESNTIESDFGENEIPDLNSLKPFEFEPKRNIGDINSSNSDDEEEVTMESKHEWCKCRAKAVVGRCSTKIGVWPATSLKRDSNTDVFLWNLWNFLQHHFLKNISTPVTASGSKQCKAMKTYAEILCCQERNNTPEHYF